MKLNRLIINNIKSFNGEHIFDFSNSDIINTVSGINGSGKTTLFKSIVYAQKVFFSEQINRQTDNHINYNTEGSTFFNGKNSFIKLEFKFNDTSEDILASFTVKCNLKFKEKVELEVISSVEDRSRIEELWNFKDPSNLIIYIDSNRNISESDFSNENIQLAQSNSNTLLLEYITSPEKIFYSTYERIIQDYIRHRVIPGSPRVDLPHFVSKIFIHEILDYLKVSNFTGLEKQNQFVLLSKNLRSNKTYDIRFLSSGEKTLFYIYHFICYVKNIGMLIIDEPENNLHENMLANFVASLNKICTEEKFSDLILKLAKKNGVNIPPPLSKQIKEFYKGHRLSQVFLLTHSKNLVFNNFTLGKNYVVDNDLTEVDYDNYEKVLREIGLSKIINKVLFVEGQTETEILDSIFSPHNIKVKSLGGCGEVIETYKRYYKIHQQIRDVQFCFLIDRDTRSDKDIDDIRKLNETFFDQHFIVMERHEIENYFLESKMFHKLYVKHKQIFSSLVVPTEEQITNDIRKIADKHMNRVLIKKIQTLNQKSLANLKLAISGRDIPLEIQGDYDKYIDTAFDVKALNNTISLIKNNYQEIINIRSIWDDDWLRLCDGKIVLNEFIGSFSAQLSINSKRAKSELVNLGLNETQFQINLLVKSILKKLK